jgi:hypothetical protein
MNQKGEGRLISPKEGRQVKRYEWFDFCKRTTYLGISIPKEL